MTETAGQDSLMEKSGLWPTLRWACQGLKKKKVTDDKGLQRINVSRKELNTNINKDVRKRTET